MTTSPPHPIGSIGWCDLTVPDASNIRDFYTSVCGWSATDVSMGDYADYAMTSPGGQMVAGICHKRGVNADLPSQWLMYVTVADLAASLEQVQTRGGKILRAATPMGAYGTLAVIQDPAGAVIALLQPNS